MQHQDIVSVLPLFQKHKGSREGFIVADQEYYSSVTSSVRTDTGRRRISSVSSELQCLPRVTRHETSCHRTNNSKSDGEDKDGHGKPESIPLKRISTISPNQFPGGRV